MMNINDNISPENRLYKAIIRGQSNSELIRNFASKNYLLGKKIGKNYNENESKIDCVTEREISNLEAEITILNNEIHLRINNGLM